MFAFKRLWFFPSTIEFLRLSLRFRKIKAARVPFYSVGFLINLSIFFTNSYFLTLLEVVCTSPITLLFLLWFFCSTVGIQWFIVLVFPPPNWKPLIQFSLHFWLRLDFLFVKWFIWIFLKIISQRLHG